LAAEAGVGENEFVARVSTESKVRPGQTVELAFDTTKLVVFDADTGVNLTIPPPGAREEQAAPASASPPPQAAQEEQTPHEDKTPHEDQPSPPAE
jgi:multiple sugar transport system ATP-binding protein